MIKNTIDTYGWLTKVFHWLSVLIIVGLFALGFWMVDLTYYSNWYKTAPHIHRSIGLLFAIFIICRLCWRRMNLSVMPLTNHKAWEVSLAHFVHIVLYALMFSMFVTGYLISTAKGQAVDVFNFFSLPALITGDMIGVKNLEDLAGEVHEILAYCLIGLASLHALAALKHHFIDKDITLLRMLKKKSG